MKRVKTHVIDCFVEGTVFCWVGVSQHSCWKRRESEVVAGPMLAQSGALTQPQLGSTIFFDCEVEENLSYIRRVKKLKIRTPCLVVRYSP